MRQLPPPSSSMWYVLSTLAPSQFAGMTWPGKHKLISTDFLEPVCTPCRKDSFSCDRGPMSQQYSSFEQSLAVARRNAVAARQLAPAPRPSTVSTSTNDDVWLSHLYTTLGAREKIGSAQREWIGFCAASHAPGGLASSSLGALACAFFGRSQGRIGLLRQGGNQYTTCLRRVNERLGDSALKIDGDMLLAVTILGYYESLLSTARFAWTSHYLGLARLLELAGPVSCRDPLVFNIFVDSRFMMILAALAVVEDTCFSRPEWKTVPWQAVLQRKGGMDVLLDSLADLAHARSSQGLQTRAAQAITVLQDLDKWRQMEMPSLQANFISSSDKEPSYPSAWPAPLTCSVLTKANCYCLYHATSILAAECATTISGESKRSWDDMHALSQLQHDSAVEICRTLTYHFAATSSLYGSLFILWPFRMAVKVLKEGSSEEISWTRHQIGKYITSRGIWEIQQEAFDGL